MVASVSGVVPTILPSRNTDAPGGREITLSPPVKPPGGTGGAGVLERGPPDAKRARYRLTPAGEALRPHYDAIKAGGDAWLPRGTKENGPGSAGPSVY